MAKEIELSTQDLEHRNGQATNGNPSAPDADELIKMTLYIRKSVSKAIKKLAIDNEMEFSELANAAFIEYVQKHHPAYLARNDA
jgi:hypothetical protein